MTEYETFLLILGGIVFFLIAYVKLRDFSKYQKKGIRTKGIVEDLIKEYGKRETNYFYYPVIYYQTNEGREIQKKYNIGTNPASYKIKQEVEVIYLPESPLEYMINDARSRYIYYTFAVLGIIVFLVGLFFLSKIYF